MRKVKELRKPELKLGKRVDTGELGAVLVDTGHPLLREHVVCWRDAVMPGVAAVGSDRKDVALPADERRRQLSL